MHIEHVVPFSMGGCNDLVNLQILCSGCNIKKGGLQDPVRSSIPALHSITPLTSLRGDFVDTSWTQRPRKGPKSTESLRSPKTRKVPSP